MKFEVADAKTHVMIGDVREGEKPRFWYRNDRLFKNSGKWFFQTREGIDVGPYGCEFDAALELEIMIRRLRDAQPEQALKIIQNHLYDVRSGGGSSLNTAAFTSYVVEGGVELLRQETSI
jgi:hypothetical protein